jgi:hypothetical protein
MLPLRINVSSFSKTFNIEGNQTMAKSKKKSTDPFAELKNAHRPTVEDVKRALRECAESGAAIDGDTVNRVIGNLRVIKVPDALHMAESVGKGIEIQARLKNLQGVLEYKKVLDRAL